MAGRGVVVSLGVRPEAGPLQSVVDTLQAVLGKMVSLADVPLVLATAGYVTAAAAASPGTSEPTTRVSVDFADAGVDQVRLVARAKNSGAGAVTLALYDVTNSATLATVVVTGVTTATYVGAWTTLKPSGTDQELELRVVGSGETPTVYALHAQLRTLQARK